MAIIEIKLESILDQGGTPYCSAFAIAGVANYLFAKKGSGERVNPVKLFKEAHIGNDTGGVSLFQGLQIGMVKGLPLTDGDRKFIKDIKRILPGYPTIRDELKKGNPLVFEYQVPNGKSFKESIESPNFVFKNPLETHSMVFCGFNDTTKQFKVANSYGPNFGIGGYFYLDYMNAKSPLLIDCYSFSV